MASFSPADLILKALDVEIVYPENWGALCASRRLAEEYLNNSDSDGFPTSICGYARNTIGYTKKLAENNFIIPNDAPAGGMAKPVVLLGSGVICDTRFKWFQALRKYMDVPIYVLESPQPGVKESLIGGVKKQNVKYMADDCKKFLGFIENLLGKKMDWDKLEELTDRFERSLRLINKIDKLRQAVPSPMVGQDFWTCMIGLFMAYDIEALEMFEELYNEVKYRVDHKIEAIVNEKYRVIFGEIPPWHSLDFFDDIADEFGIAIVMESYAYHYNSPPLEEDLEKATDPIERVCYWTYNHFTQNHAASAYHMDVQPGYLVQPYINWAEEYKADGAIFHPLMSCRPVGYTMIHTSNLLNKLVNVPSIMVEGDMVDLRVFNKQEAKDRVAAFLETMDFYRDIRAEKRITK